MRRAAGLLVGTSILGFVSHGLAAPRSKPQASRPELVFFATADRDADGSVSLGELAKVLRESLARRIEKRFRQLDRNHDGRCTRAEVNKMSAARFARFDLDRDGHFTVAELTTVMNREFEVRLTQMYLRLDADQDGQLSLAELTPRPQPAAPKVAASSPVEVARRGTTNVH